MTGGRTKRIQSSTGVAAKKPLLCRFFSPSHAEFFKKVNVSPCVCVDGYRGSRRRGSASSRKVNIRRGDVFRHSGLRKYVSTDTTHTKQLKHAQPGLRLEEPRLMYSSHGYTCDAA